MPHKVGPKGQIVIDKQIRDRLGIETGWLALQRLVDNHVEVYFVPPEHRRSLKGSLAQYIKRPLEPDEDWHKLGESAWGIAARDKADVKENVP